MRLPARVPQPIPSPHTPPSLSDAELVARLRAGDEKAFERLFTTYYASLRDFVISYLRSAESAEEVVQTVLLRVWEQRRTWRPHNGVRAYLFGACRNAALDVLRHMRTVERIERAMASTGERPAMGSIPLAPDEMAVARDLSAALHAATAELPERQREVIVLRWQHQLGPTEIAHVLGISVKGVEAHFARAFATLRKRLAEFG